MKKLSIADVKASEILSKEERKMVVGGSFYRCYGSTPDGQRHYLGGVVSDSQSNATMKVYDQLVACDAVDAFVFMTCE